MLLEIIAMSSLAEVNNQSMALRGYGDAPCLVGLGWVVLPGRKT